MYCLTIYELIDGCISGVVEYENFEYSIVPKVGQWIVLPNKDGEQESVYKVVQIAIPLRNIGGNHAEIYVVRFENNGEVEDILCRLHQTFSGYPT